MRYSLKNFEKRIAAIEEKVTPQEPYVIQIRRVIIGKDGLIRTVEVRPKYIDPEPWLKKWNEEMK